MLRVFVAFAMLLLALVVVIIAFTQTDRFREIVRQQAVHALSALVPARVSIGRVEGSIWSRIGLVDVVADYHDEALVRVRRLQVHYRLLSLLKGRLHVSRLEVVDPLVVVRRLADGTWNVANAFRVPAGQESSNGAAGLDVVVDRVVVRGGVLDLVLTDDNPERYRVTDLAVSLHGRISAGGLFVQVDSLSCDVVADPYPVVRVNTALTYREEGGEATLEISALQLAGPHSLLLVQGQIRDFESPVLDARVTVEKLSSIDLRAFRPDWPLRPDISGEARLTGSLADLRVTLELRAAGAEVSGHVRVDLKAHTPVYSGGVRLAGADLHALLGTGLAGVVDGSAEVRGVGTELSSLETDARLEVRALQVDAWRVGDVVVAGSLKNLRG